MPTTAARPTPQCLRTIVLALQQQGLLPEGPIPQPGPAGEHPLETLARLNLQNPRAPSAPLSLEALAEWLAQQAQLPYRRIDPLHLDAALAASHVPAPFARHHQILAVEACEGQLVVATAQPWLRDWEAPLAGATQRKIQRVVANPQALRQLIEHCYSLARSVQGVAQATQAALQVREGAVQAPAQETPVAGIIDWLLGHAARQHASDVHLEPRETCTQLRLRIDGQLLPVYRFPPAVGVALVSRFKSLAQLNLAEKRKPQDGRFTHAVDGKAVQLRLSTLPTAFGEKAVLRLLDPAMLEYSFARLGLAGRTLVRWEQAICQPNGIVLVTGPTGSGKTTTLYATLNVLARPEVNLCTLEDPVEIVHPALNQMQVKPSIGLDFASGLRALMRQDPDIIMLGEIRDSETACMAAQAALTGHLVLSTLHTNDAPEAITRLAELGVPAYLLNATLRGVMAQRLLRTLCHRCKAPTPIEEHAWRALASPWTARLPRQLFKAIGCEHCHGTGYQGRVAVYELMLMTDTLRALVRKEGDSNALRAQACREHMQPLRLGALAHLASGRTSLDEMLRVTGAASGISPA